MRDKRVIYYSDPLHDDFAETNITAREVGADFPFVHGSLLWRCIAFLLYYLIACPVIFLISKCYMGLRFENREVLEELQGTGYFLYGNHTRMLDAFLPALTAFPKRAYVVSNPDAVSIPGLKALVSMLGVIPIPTQFSGMRNYLSSIKQRYEENSAIAIFPEAHIWPFYTDIRPFSDTSFRYPVRLSAPVVAMVSTYRKRRGLGRLLFRRPAMTVTVSDPFYPDPNLPPKEAQAELRNQVYGFMKAVSARPDNVEYIAYRKKEEESK